MYGSLDISTSGMIAQRTRMAVISANIANANTILDSQGKLNPYKKRIIHFAPGDPTAANPAARAIGVQISEIGTDENAIRMKYEPGSKYADKDGYVPYPDISPEIEQINAMMAARSYEANVAAAETTKTMMAQALRLLA
ncbi:MAG: flagellar basal body rod protein FlgC [Phycisphaeraceae bacterium]|nr:MAG: flagellar basal body rod protein FlgC [Phycisphaeraceae bacterium]